MWFPQIGRVARLTVLSARCSFQLPWRCGQILHHVYSPFPFSPHALSNLGYRQQQEEETTWGSGPRQGGEPIWGSIQQQERESTSGSIMQQQEEEEKEEESTSRRSTRQAEENPSLSRPKQEAETSWGSIHQGKGEPTWGSGLEQQEKPIWVQVVEEEEEEEPTWSNPQEEEEEQPILGSGHQQQQQQQGEEEPTLGRSSKRTEENSSLSRLRHFQPTWGNGLKQQQESIWVQEEDEPAWRSLEQQQEEEEEQPTLESGQPQPQPQGEEEPIPGRSTQQTEENPSLSRCEVRRFLRLTNVEAMKQTLSTYKQESIPCGELLRLCRSTGIVSSRRDALAFMQALDEAGVVFTLRDRVYLNPQQIADIVVKAVSIPLSKEDKSQLQELQRLRKEKDYIDKAAHKHVRVVLWSGLGYLTLQCGLFFRLTYWELSWDAVEPMAFFVTTSGFIASYLYFLFTSSDPTYHNITHRVFRSKQRKLMEMRNFDNERFLNLERVYGEI